MSVINKQIFLRDRREFLDRLDVWQRVVDQIAETYGGAASLICQLTDTGIRPVVSSVQDSNPLAVGATFPPEAHTFCDEVITRNDSLYVSNAEEDPNWSTSPGWRELGFCSYYGLPIKWPGEEMFGTICVMDHVATDYQTPFLAWMACFRDLVESDLAMAAQLLDRTQYFGEISQDLKSSVSNIVGHTDSLMLSALSEAQRLDVNIIQNCAESLVCLLNDVLETAKIDATGPGMKDSSGFTASPRVLVVEDNHINQKVTGSLLESLAFDFEFADDGVDAVTTVKSSEFDIILMDIQMPRMDGLEATRQIRAMGGWQETVPIIAVTANAMVNDKYQCIDAGMNDVLAKPIEPENFMRLMLSYSGQVSN